MSYLLIKAPRRPSPATADLLPLLLRYIIKRGPSLRWKIINADVVLKQGYLIADFKEKIVNELKWEELLLLLDKVDTLIEITLVVSTGFDIAISHINNSIERRDFSQVDILIDFFDSSEWVFFSSVEEEMSAAFRDILTDLPELEIVMHP